MFGCDETFPRTGFLSKGQDTVTAVKGAACFQCTSSGTETIKFKSLGGDSEREAPPKAHATGPALGLSLLLNRLFTSFFLQKLLQGLVLMQNRIISEI